MKTTVYCIVLTFILSVDARGQEKQDTVSSHGKVWWKRAEWIAPTTLIVAGSIAATDKDADEFFISNYEVWEERNEAFVNFSSALDNYMQHLPAATALALGACGVKGRSDFANQVAIFVKSEILLTAIVFPLKQLASEKRPDTGKRNAFPSGHTAQAFMTATFLAKEYGGRSIWISIAGYTMATTVGVFRILNNRHWISDILVGAGIGVLSTNLVYATHQYKWGKRGKKKSGVVIAPTYSEGAVGAYMRWQF